MNHLLILLLALAALLGGWFLLGSEAGPNAQDTAPTTLAAGDTAAADSRSRQAASAPAEATPTVGRPASGTADAPPARAQLNGRDPRQPAAAADRPVDYAALSAPAKMRRLGWPLDDPRGAFVSRWVEHKLAEDADFFDEIERAADRDKPAVMRRFNDATAARRQQLVQSLGMEAGGKVADEWCLYQFDTTNGRWHRIDITGTQVPFRNEDDDVWSGWEMSNANWGNHRSR